MRFVSPISLNNSYNRLTIGILPTFVIDNLDLFNGDKEEFFGIDLVIREKLQLYFSPSVGVDINVIVPFNVFASNNGNSYSSDPYFVPNRALFTIGPCFRW